MARTENVVETRNISVEYQKKAIGSEKSVGTFNTRDGFSTEQQHYGTFCFTTLKRTDAFISALIEKIKLKNDNNIKT